MVQAHFGGKELCTSINADECVAHGAAVLAAQRIDGSKAIKLKDVAPLSIGIGVKGGIIKVRENARKRSVALVHVAD
jgi:L1 cell adhesion molecule like protein